MVVRCGARGGSLGLPTVFVAVPTPVDCRLHRKETAKKMLCKSDWCFVSVRESECIHGTKNSPKNFTVFRSSQLLHTVSTLPKLKPDCTIPNSCFNFSIACSTVNFKLQKTKAKHLHLAFTMLWLEAGKMIEVYRLERSVPSGSFRASGWRSFKFCRRAPPFSHDVLAARHRQRTRLVLTKTTTNFSEHDHHFINGCRSI